MIKTDFDNVLEGANEGVQKTPKAEKPNNVFEEKKRRIKECRAELIQLLSHDKSPTLYRLAQVLHQQARLIEAECTVEHWLDTFPSGE